MATTNMQPWNPTAANQENDAAYTADPQRAGGATDPSVFQSVLANKLFYQTTIYLTAFFTAFANKGFSTSDSNLPTLIAQCANFLVAGDPIASASSSAAPIISATQLGSTYSSTPSQAAISAVTQNPVGADNYLFSGQLAGTGVTYWVRADGVIAALALQLSGGLIAATAAISGAINAASIALSGALSAASANISGIANMGFLQINGTGVNGQVLKGNGTSYVPVALVLLGVPNDVTGARTFSTTYTNGPNQRIVTGYGRTAGSSVGSVQATIANGGGPTTVYANTTAATVSNGACGFSFIVPPGFTYAILANTLTNGMGSAVTAVGAWVETDVSI